MIELSRKQIQCIRTTLRQAQAITSARRAPVVTFEATSDALLIRAMTDTLAVEYQVPGNRQAACFAIPFEALAACEGRQNDAVQFEQAADQVTLRWIDSNIPQSCQFPTSEPVSMPELPGDLVPIDPQFLYAMADACETTENDSTRFALNCVRLRGADGQIAATDSHQALIQHGYQFPWTEEVLIPATAFFAAKSVRNSRNVCIGRSADWVFVRANDWTVALKIEKERRFPSIDAQVPNSMEAASTLVLAGRDRSGRQSIGPSLSQIRWDVRR